MKENEKMHLPKVSVDDFFTTQKERDEQKKEKIEIIPTKKIRNFKNHPYKINDDEDMYALAQSIKEVGVLNPTLIRPIKDDNKYEYEMVSGNRRKRACELAGLSGMPAIIREMTDDEAIIYMVDSNKQREKVLPSEKAFAYKMRLEAMKRQAGRPKKDSLENSAPTEQNFFNKTTREILAEEVGESSSNIQRYIRLTELIPEILELVDSEQMMLRPAVEISYLKKDEQEYLLESIEYNASFPSHPQAIKLRKLSENKELTEEKIDEILSTEKPNQKENVKLSDDELKPYYPKNVISMEDKKKYILYCVKETTERERKKKQYVR